MTTRILLIEDDEDDYIITRDLLDDIRDGDFELTWAHTFEKGQDALDSGDFEICLVDYHVGQRSGLELVEEARASGCLVPMILLTGVAARDVDMAAMRAGAADFMEKGELTPVLLERTIRYALNQSRSRRALVEKSALLRTTLEYTGAGIATYDANRKLLTWNERLLDMLCVGRRPEQSMDATGLGESAVPESELGEAISSRLAEAQIVGLPHVEYVSADDRCLEIRQNPMPGGGSVVICTDITDRKAVEAHLERHQEELERQVAVRTAELETLNTNLETVVSELREAKEASEAANRAKSDFLAMMSHEIRTPMNGIIGMVQLLARTGLDARQQHYSGSIESSAESLLAIINDILDFSKVEAGKLAISADVFEPLSLFDRIADAFSSRAQAKGIDLLCHFDPRIDVDLIGDEVRLTQILTNLVGNAVKFTESGEVTVRAGCLDTFAPRRAIRFEVEDTGIGMTPDACARVFDSFVQADGSTTRRFGGTGLGLAIAKRLIELMGGEIHLDSRIGEGTRFWFDVPFEAGPSGRSVAADLSGCSGQNALVVSRSPSARAVLCEQLQTLNVTTEEASDVRDAFERLRHAGQAGAPPPMVFADRDLAELDGIALAFAMAVEPALAETTVVLMSPFESIQDSMAVPAKPRVIQVSKPLLLSQIAEVFAATASADGAVPGSSVAASAADTDGDINGRILVAEDNPVNQEVVRAMLEVWGCSVDMADNGEDAVAAVRRSEPDLVLMDCQMPIMDGFEATAQIRALNAKQPVSGRPLPIIALTANAMPGDRERCLAAGMDDFLQKPFKERALRECIERWLATDGSSVVEAECASETPPPADTPPSSSEEQQPPAAAAMPENPGGTAEGPSPEVRELAGHAIFDGTVLDGLRRLQRPGKPDLVTRVVDSYIPDATRLVDDIARAVADGDADTLQRSAHKLKSSSAEVGAMRLSAACKSLEMMGRSGTVDAAPALVDVARSSLAGALESLEGLRRAAYEAA